MEKARVYHKVNTILSYLTLYVCIICLIYGAINTCLFQQDRKTESILMCLDNPSAAQKAEFQSEIEQMKLLGSHPNIVSLVGCCTFRDEKFLVIEYVPFGDLLTWLRCRRRRVRKWNRWFSIHSKKRVCLHASVHGDYLVALKVLGYLVEAPL